MGFFDRFFRREKNDTINITSNNSKKEDTQFNTAEQELTKKFGKKPSQEDVKWRVYNQRIIEYASKRQRGLYRNNKLDMAKLLIEEARHKQALSTLFEICYLDLNGCNNIGEGISTEDMEKIDIREFDTKMAFLAPGIVRIIEDEITKLKISNDDAKKLFIDINNQMKPKKNMPLNPEEAWGKLVNRINKNQKIQSINPKDIPNTFKEIEDLIKNKEYNDVVALIQKLKSTFYSKKQERPSIKDIKEHLPELLNSKHPIISNAAESLLITIAKKDADSIEDLLVDYVKRIQNNFQESSESSIIGEIALINVELVKILIPKLIKNLREHPEWNVRRFSAFNLGTIGMKHSDLVKEAVPIMINYIKKPYEVTKRQPLKVKTNDYSISMDLSAEKMLGVDQRQWLKDVYIDSIAMIAKGDKQLILKYKALFKDIADKDKSEYSRKKAKKVIDNLEK